METLLTLANFCTGILLLPLEHLGKLMLPENGSKHYLTRRKKIELPGVSSSQWSLLDLWKIGFWNLLSSILVQIWFCSNCRELDQGFSCILLFQISTITTWQSFFPATGRVFFRSMGTILFRLAKNKPFNLKFIYLLSFFSKSELSSTLIKHDGRFFILCEVRYWNVKWIRSSLIKFKWPQLRQCFNTWNFLPSNTSGLLKKTIVLLGKCSEILELNWLKRQVVLVKRQNEPKEIPDK